MTMTLLEVIQEFADRQLLDRPNIVMGSQDDTIRQLRGLANEVITDICTRGESWTILQKQTTFVTVAAESQGAIATIAPYGFKFIIEDTLYDRTARRQLYGPKGAADWQEAEALPFTGPMYAYRVWQGNFLMQPAPPAGHTVAFEYASDMAIQGPLSATDDTPTWRKRFAFDSDVFMLDEDLLLMGLRWKWRNAQGLSYAQQKLDFEAQVAQAIGTSPTKGTINMATGGSPGVKPGIFVPLGNWNV